jgi:acyl carrier protein
MNTVSEILEQVNEIFRDILDNDEIVVYEKTTAEDVAEWDSLSHIQLVVAVEKHFKIRFTASEINGFKNVGEMCEGILKKLTAK